MTEPVMATWELPYLRWAGQFLLLTLTVVVAAKLAGVKFRFAQVHELIEQGGADPFESEHDRRRL